jgi:asparagine synthase (glutamine-hydrolysing)
MCGIVGIWNQQDEATVARMAQSIASRGPDGIDWIVRDNNSLGASRLSIVGDPKASAIYFDPLTGVSVLLNGEIYNVNELRNQLVSRGIVFHSNLESEVIAKLYQIYGLAFAKLLKGMFAIAIVGRDRLVLARDKFGIKPIYYVDHGDSVAFASEIKALLEHPNVSTQLDISALQQSIVFGYVYAEDKTLFEGIHQVEPGTVAEFAINKRHIHRFWQLPQVRYQKETEVLSYHDAIAGLRETIIGTMDLLLHHGGDSKGIYLSGGLDSTILTLVAQNILGYPVTTFTLADDPGNPDFMAAKEVAGKIGTRHVERIVGLQDYFETLEDFIYHYEALLLGGVFDIQGAPAFHLLSQTVSEHVRVAFSGEGADELFGGYYWIYTHPLGFSDRIRNRLESIPAQDAVRQMVNELFPFPENEKIYQRNLLDALMKTGLSNCHLQSVDRSSGAFGFEVRPAYLYDDLAEFALRLPIEYKVPDVHTTKMILRDAFRPELERLGLDWVLTRKKQGMPSALANIAGQIQERMESVVSDIAFSERPSPEYLHTKTDTYLFNIFRENFLSETANV